MRNRNFRIPETKKVGMGVFPHTAAAVVQDIRGDK